MSTSIPLEIRLREPIEKMVSSLLKDFSESDEEAVTDIGADISSMLVDKINKCSNIEILCAYNNY